MDAALPNFKSLFESVPGLYLVLDPQLRIIAASDAYLHATLTRRADVLGRGIFDVFPDNPADAAATGVHNLRSSLERVLRDRVPDAMALQKYDVRRPADQGAGFEEKWWSPLNSPVFDVNGRITCIIHRVEDVTEYVRLKQQGAEQSRISAELQARVEHGEFELYRRAAQVQEANQQLAAANGELSRVNEQLRELDDLKTQFFANVSHELRTPLTLILGPVRKHLQDGLCPLEIRRDLEMVERSARVLLTHVNDLLDISKLEVGRMQLSYSRVDLALLARQVTAHFESVAADRSVQLRTEGSAPIWIELDSDKVRRILFNLISNAIKFTPAGGAITVGVAAEGGEAVLTVWDSGPGIPANERAAVFERFHQGSQGGSMRQAGTGLGLAIVKEFAELHHGSVLLDEPPGGGARFVVRLPRKAAPGTSISSATSQDEVPSASYEFPVGPLRLPPPPKQSASEFDVTMKDGALVLIVEDNADMRAFLVDALRAHYRVALAEDGQDGFEKACMLRPDLVISDMMMPRLTGEGLAAKLRERVELRDAPLIFLTAKEDDNLRVRLLQQGAQDYISKPFSTPELLARVERRLADRRQVRERLLRGERLESVGRLAAGVAHDFNNLLTAMVGYAQLISDPAAGKDEDVRHARSILSVAERATSMTRQLLAFARKQPVQPRIFDLNQLIRDAEPLLRQLIRADIQLQLKLRAGPSSTLADPGQIEQVLINLVANARDAMEERGTLTIGTGNQTQPTAGCGVSAEYVVMSVTDTGTGIDEQVRSRLFEPFFTTKGRGQGTGFGLASSHGIVQQAGGHIEVQSQVGRGTTFEVFLPMSDQAQNLELQQSAPADRFRRRILLADDDELVRWVLVTSLRNAGFEVAEAGNGVEALRICEANGSTFDLLVTDTLMPQMNGIELAKKMRAAHPALRVLFVSGSMDEPASASGMPEQSVSFLPKPFTTQVLTQRVREILS